MALLAWLTLGWLLEPPPAPAQGGGPTLTTDKQDYFPTDTVTITGTGFAPNTAYDLPIIRPDSSIVKGDGSSTPGWDSVTSSASGSFTYLYQLDGIEGTYEVRAYASPWSGNVAEAPLATTTFMDASIDFTQCLNDSNSDDVIDNCSWSTGAINGSNSAYAEGNSVPQRLFHKVGLAGTHTMRFEFEFTTGNIYAYDFLANADDTMAVGAAGLNECGDLPPFVSSPTCASAFSGAALSSTPSDPFDAVVSRERPALRNLRLGCSPACSGSVTVSFPSLDGGDDPGEAHDPDTDPDCFKNCGSSAVMIDVTLTTAAANTLVGVWFGGHLAEAADPDPMNSPPDGWGTGCNGGGSCGASAISGAPFHLRYISLDGGAVGSRDNQIQSGAIIVRTNTPVPTATGTKTPSTTPTRTASNTPTHSPTAQPTSSPTPTPTVPGAPTDTPTQTPTTSQTSSATVTPTLTATVTPTPEATLTGTETPTQTSIETPTATPTPTSTCGNGVVDPGEMCDLGSGNCLPDECCASDCSSNCELIGRCTGTQECCTGDTDCPPGEGCCGNGILEGNEQCDDGNRLDGDCCSATCQLEPPPCVPLPEPCAGPGVLDVIANPTLRLSVLQDSPPPDMTLDRWSSTGDFDLPDGVDADPDTEVVHFILSQNDGANQSLELYHPILDPPNCANNLCFTARTDAKGQENDWKFRLRRSQADIAGAPGWRQGRFRRSSGLPSLHKFRHRGQKADILDPQLTAGTRRVRQSIVIGDVCVTRLLDCEPNLTFTRYQCRPAHCGNGQIDRREQCGEPGLPVCPAGRACDTCRCIPSP